MSGWLIDTVIYTGLLIALVLVLRRPIGRVFGPQIAYTLWALPFLRLLLPPIVLPASYGPAAEPIAAAPADMQWVEVVQPTDAGEVPLEPVTFAAPPAPVEAGWDWAVLIEIAALLWAIGALGFLAWRVVTYHRMRRELLASARPVGEIGKIRLVETPALAAPVAFGVLDRVIALPPLFMAQPDIAARDLAIEHELAHHRGHDLLANFLAQAVLALHWCNPVAWYGWRAMRRDQEAACDARVLSGRSRDERALYAALIADIAAGPRLALAAPMACPVLGERSIIHRLQSFSTLDISMRRRWLGRALVAAGAFALPLTASISYSAVAQEPGRELPPAPPADAATVAPPAAVESPAAPAEPEVVDPDLPRVPHMQRFVMERDENGNPVVRQFTLRREGPWPTPNGAPMPQMQHFEFHGWGNPDDPEFEAKMQKWAEDMEEWGKKWGEEYGDYWQDWGEEQREQALEQAGRQREQSLERAERRREQALAQGERQREQALARAERARTYGASSSLRRARESIARNMEMSEEVRNEVLADLDQEIQRIERGDDN